LAKYFCSNYGRNLFINMVPSLSGPLTRLSKQGQRPKTVEATIRHAGLSRYESGQNKINLDTVIYLTFVTKFSFSFQIWRIYICKKTTCIELKQFITKSDHKKSQDVNRNDVYRKDL
jgi:hypothetical protein